MNLQGWFESGGLLAMGVLAAALRRQIAAQAIEWVGCFLNVVVRKGAAG